MNTDPDLAIWAITPGGLQIAKKLMKTLKNAVLFLSEGLDSEMDTNCFHRLSPAVLKNFYRYQGHIFIMSTGIVVRVIAPLIQHKTQDPAVVVINDTGEFAIPLLSGHIGGANALAKTIAGITNGVAVITTATDSNGLPAIDMMAMDQNLIIENPDAIKKVNMAFIKREPVRLVDPYNRMKGITTDTFFVVNNRDKGNEHRDKGNGPVVEISDLKKPEKKDRLYLRPQILSVGIGCNRGTSAVEIKDLMIQVFQAKELSMLSIQYIATIDIKKEEQGILTLADELGVAVRFYTSNELNQVTTIKTPSIYAKKYTGARSVCEAAAILAANSGKLIATKKKTQNVTLAIARIQTDSVL